jgi:hypothetical protein
MTPCSRWKTDAWPVAGLPTRTRRKRPPFDWPSGATALRPTRRLPRCRIAASNAERWSASNCRASPSRRFGWTSPWCMRPSRRPVRATWSSCSHYRPPGESCSRPGSSFGPERSQRDPIASAAVAAMTPRSGSTPPAARARPRPAGPVPAGSRRCAPSRSVILGGLQVNEVPRQLARTHRPSYPADTQPNTSRFGYLHDTEGSPADSRPTPRLTKPGGQHDNSRGDARARAGLPGQPTPETRLTPGRISPLFPRAAARPDRVRGYRLPWARAVSTRRAKAAGSLTARSARTFRSRLMPAFLSPLMKLE